MASLLDWSASDLRFVKLRAGVKLHRVHHQNFGPVQYNPGFGYARFSPLKRADGSNVPTIYAGSDFEGALMETILHDVPLQAGEKLMAGAKLVGQVYSVLELKSALKLVDLTKPGLNSLGIKKTDLIETESAEYPSTQACAAKIYAASPKAQGLYWVSRQHDRKVAVMLFEDRVPVTALAVEQSSVPILEDEEFRLAMLKLAQYMGVNFVDLPPMGASKR